MIKLLGLSAAVIATMSIGFYFYYQHSQNTIQDITRQLATMTVAFEQEKVAVEHLQTVYKKQTSTLLQLAEDNTNLSQDKDRLVDKLIKHDLEELSRAKPNLVEGIINNGTQEVFDNFRDITSQ